MKTSVGVAADIFVAWHNSIILVPDGNDGISECVHDSVDSRFAPNNTTQHCVYSSGHVKTFRGNDTAKYSSLYYDSTFPQCTFQNSCWLWFEVLQQKIQVFTVSFLITIYQWTCCRPIWLESSDDCYWLIICNLCLFTGIFVYLYINFLYFPLHCCFYSEVVS
jgi:hypothetical protein